MKRVDGKAAIATGGAGALGSATATRLAQEGSRVVVAGLNMTMDGDRNFASILH